MSLGYFELPCHIFLLVAQRSLPSVPLAGRYRLWLSIAIVALGVPECPRQRLAYFLYEVYGYDDSTHYLDENGVEEDGNIGEKHSEDSIEGYQCEHPRTDFL